MIIAVAAADGKITRYFEEVQYFEIYEADKKRQRKIADLKVNNHGNIPEMLKENKVSLVICGNLDFHTENDLYHVGMEVIRDAEGYVCNVLNAWQMGYLEPMNLPVCENARFDKRLYQ